MEFFISNLGLLILRVGLGSMMIVHGAQKLKIIASGRAGQWLDPIGIGSIPSLYLATFAEFFCSVLLIFGLFPRVSAVILAITMFVAGFIFLKGASWNERELSVLFFVGFLSLIFLGGGDFSVSSVLFKNNSFLLKL